MSKDIAKPLGLVCSVCDSELVHNPYNQTVSCHCDVFYRHCSNYKGWNNPRVRPMLEILKQKDNKLKQNG